MPIWKLLFPVTLLLNNDLKINIITWQIINTTVGQLLKNNTKTLQFHEPWLYKGQSPLLGILVLNALQLRNWFGLFNFFGFERLRWVFCRRNARLAYKLNLVLVSMMSSFTTTGSMPLLVEIYFPEGITSPVVSTFCADMNCHWYGYIYKGVGPVRPLFGPKI